MCNCQNNQNSNITSSYPIMNNIVQPCNYTLDTILTWKDLLFCASNNNYLTQLQITQAQYNMCIGVVLSVINTQNPCFLATNLDSVKPFIIKIINANIC